MYLEAVTLGDEGVIYDGPDNMGMMLPYNKNEWVRLVLKDIENGKTKKNDIKIKLDAFRRNEVSPNELLMLGFLWNARTVVTGGMILLYFIRREYISRKMMVLIFPLRR